MADDVEIDLNGFSISGPDKKNVNSVGIYSTGSNTVVKNGSISGFMYGIKIEKAAKGTIPENINIYNLKISNNSFRAIGVNQANEINIHDNDIKDTGGNKLFPDAFSFAIEIINGSNNNIYDNKIFNTFALDNGESVGISLSNQCVNCSIHGNSIKNLDMGPLMIISRDFCIESF